MSSHTDTKTFSPQSFNEGRDQDPISPPEDFVLENGTNSTYKDINHKSLPDPNLLHSEAFRRLSTSTLGAFSEDTRASRSQSFSSQNPASRSAASKGKWRAACERFWQRNRGLWLVSMSQFFGALMNVAARVLETEKDGMHPFQILFVRMGMTTILCCLYMWYKKVEHFPLGQKKIRGLLVCRGLVGFFGIFGMYYSLLYIPLADAVVITFLAPSVAGYACYLLIGEPFTRMEQIASFIALSGVILIARPTSFFSTSQPENTDPNDDYSQPTSAERLSAIGVAMVGVLGSAGAYTTLRWIGKNAHPLISVNYFSTWCTILSTAVLSLAPHFGYPELHFVLPKNLQQWLLLSSLGLCGFIMQFLLTAGMAHEKSNRATNMVYTNMLWALLFDRWVFGTSPSWWSIFGSSLILGSAVYVAVQKGAAPTASAGTLAETERRVEEGRGMLSDVDGQDDVELDNMRR